MSVVNAVAALLHDIEVAIDTADFELLAGLDVGAPAGGLPEAVELAELHYLLARANQLRERVAGAMAEVQAELGSLDTHRTAGRAYIAAQATAPIPSN